VLPTGGFFFYNGCSRSPFVWTVTATKTKNGSEVTNMAAKKKKKAAKKKK
jgi:hypothetical protein